MNFQSDQTETIAVDPTTGGKKGVKLARFDLIPQDTLWALAEHYGRNAARKYDDNNWLKGYRWSWSVASLFRHMSAWLLGQEKDKDGNYHIIAVIWHAFALATFALRRLGTDDRAASQGAPLTQESDPAESDPAAAASQNQTETSDDRDPATAAPQPRCARPPAPYGWVNNSWGM